MSAIVDQRMGALKRAQEIRLEMADKKRRIRQLSAADGAVAVADLLADPGVVGAMPVGRLLLSVRRLGIGRAQRLCDRAGIRSVDRRVGQLTRRQRDCLAKSLRLGAKS